MKIVTFAFLVLIAAAPVQAQLQGPPLSALRVDPPAPPPNAQTAATPLIALTSSAKVREVPAVQYLLMKTVVAKSIGVQKTRALPVEAGGYNLLKYCWTAANVLGDWGESSGLTGEMVVRALETLSWSRDLARAGYPEAQVAEAIGRYEAALIAASFTDAARGRALEALRTELEGLQMRTPGTSKIIARERCKRQPSSLALSVATSPDDGFARFIPFVLHQFCLAQQIDPGDAVQCDYWQSAARERPMSFASEIVYSVNWPDKTVSTGRFNPDEHRTAGTVTLRQRPPKK